MKCFQCKSVKVCMAKADMLGQVFDVNYDGEYYCADFTPLTNADRIRAKSDEELAEWAANFVIVCMKEAGIEAELDETFVPEFIEFLKRPVEEVNNG